MFKLAGFFDVADSGNACVFPYFRFGNRNAVFVQNLDSKFVIKYFVPYYDIDRYKILPYSGDHTKNVGDQGIIGVNIDNEVIVIPSVEDVRLWLRQNYFLEEGNPLLFLQLKRLVGVTFSEMYLSLERVAKVVFIGEEARRRWISSEVAIIQHAASDINRVAPYEMRENAGREASERVEEYPSALMYLMDRRNFDDDGWESTWLEVERLGGLDNMLFDLGYEWISHKYATKNLDVVQYYHVLTRLIQFEYVAYRPNADFCDFLGEVFCDGLADVVESGFPFNIIKMAIEIALHRMSLDAQLEFLSASFYFFNADEAERKFFIDRLISLLKEGVKGDVFRDAKEIVALLQSANRWPCGREGEINKLIKLYAKRI